MDSKEYANLRFEYTKTDYVVEDGAVLLSIECLKIPFKVESNCIVTQKKVKDLLATVYNPSKCKKIINVDKLYFFLIGKMEEIGCFCEEDKKFKESIYKNIGLASIMGFEKLEVAKIINYKEHE